MSLRHLGSRVHDTADRVQSAVALRFVLNGSLPPEIRRRAARAFARTRHAQQLGLADMTAERLLEVSSDLVQRACLVGTPTLTPEILIDLGTDHADLTLAAIIRLRQADPGALGEKLYQTIVLDRAGSAIRLNVSLTVAAQNVDRLAPQQARSIFERCLSILSRPVDPYDAASARAAGAARQAAAALLARNSELDELVIGQLSASEASPSLQMVVASALKEQPDRAARRFVSYLSALRPTSEQAIRYAEDCGADRGTLRPGFAERPRLRRPWGTFRSRLWAQVSLALVVPVAATVVFAYLSQSAGRAVSAVGIDPTVAIGSFGVLVAVHILAVQLAAQRLPGPIAEATALTPVTVAAYWTGFLMLVASILGKLEPSPSWKPSLVASGLLVLLFALVVVTTIQSLRSTSVASASENVGRKRLGMARHTGRIAGRLHLAAANMQRAIDTHPSLRRFTSAQETMQRYPIKAASSGYVQIEVSRLIAIAQRPRFINGEGRLDLLVAPGVAVTSGEEIASLVPVGGGQLDQSDQRAAERAFRVSGERRLERFAELCVALCAQLPLLVRAGDPGGARRVHQVLLDLLRLHLDCDLRERNEYEGTLPLSPALTQTIDRALVELKNASGREREMLARFLCDLVDLAEKDSGVVALIATRLSSQATELADFDILYAAGQRAILVESGLELASVQRSFDHLTSGKSESARFANEVAGRLVAFCAAVGPRLSRAAWSRWWDAATHTPEQDRVKIALRVGAASLPVANLALALEVSLAIAGQDLDALMGGIRDPKQAAFESFLSEAYGRLLGVDAEQRIADFIEFAKAVHAAVSGSAA